MNEMSPEEAEDMGWNDRFDMEDEDRVEGAARDMLEALKTFVAHYPMGINPFLDDAYRAARAAIAKAEGK